jgi:hypothetical protein
VAWLAVAAEDSQKTPLLGVLIALVVAGMIVVFVWNRQRQAFRSGEVELVGRQVVARNESWDHRLGRRYFLLSFTASGLLATGALLVGLGTGWGLIPLGVSLALFCLALWTLRQARGISAAAARVSGPRIRLPIMMARRHESGTWWERWAWVDTGILMATVVAATVLI